MAIKHTHPSIPDNDLGSVQIPPEALGITYETSLLTSSKMTLGCSRKDLGNSAHMSSHQGPDPTKSIPHVGSDEVLTRGYFEPHGHALRRIQPMIVSLILGRTVMDNRDSPAPSATYANDRGVKLMQVSSNYATTTHLSQQRNEQREPRIQSVLEFVEYNSAVETGGSAKSYAKHPEGLQMLAHREQGTVQAKRHKLSQDRPRSTNRLTVGT